MYRLLAGLAILLGTFCASADPPSPILLTPASAVVPALHDIFSVPRDTRCYIRYLSAYNEADTLAVSRLLAFTVNSLSSNSTPLPLYQVTPSLWRINLYELGIRCADFDRLVQLGSGPSPFPQPYFNLVSVTIVREPSYEVTQWWHEDREGNHVQPPHGYRRERQITKPGGLVNKVCVQNAPWLPQEMLDLQEQTHTQFPIVRADWFVRNALVEPRYHELLRTGESRDTLERLAAVDERLVDRVGSRAAGVALFSAEVALHNRVLNRFPTPRMYGAGVYWVSDDFASSIGVQNAVLNPLEAKADAHEFIFTLANGLNGYFLTDGKGKRINNAVANVAIDARTPLHDKQVYSARNCIGCHARGYILVDDEIRASSRLEVAALLLSQRIKDQDAFQSRFFNTQINDLIVKDQAAYEATVLTTTGVTAASIAARITQATLLYEDAPLNLAVISRETGYPEDVLTAIAKANLTNSNVAVGVSKLAPRLQRRDQFEADFGLIMSALIQVPVVEVRK